MELSSLIGLAVGIAILAASLGMKQVPLEGLMQPVAWLIVLGGTATACLIHFSAAALANACVQGGQSLFRRPVSLQAHIEDLVEIAQFVRRQGILSLQPLLGPLERQDPYLFKGLTLAMDNTSKAFLKDSLATEVEMVYKNRLQHARVFESAGGYAPTMGLMGALIGLMATVQGLSDLSVLGSGIASAFSATLLGIALANMLLLPMAGKLRESARTEWLQHTISMQAILSIQASEHPLVLQQKLQAFLLDQPLEALADSVRVPTPAEDRLPAAAAERADVPEPAYIG